MILDYLIYAIGIVLGLFIFIVTLESAGIGFLLGYLSPAGIIIILWNVYPYISDSTVEALFFSAIFSHGGFWLGLISRGLYGMYKLADRISRWIDE